MSKYSKESLEKLLLLIDEICNEEENLWFKNKLKAFFLKDLNIYNYAFKEKFDAIEKYLKIDGVTLIDYSKIKDENIRNQLFRDCIEMSKYRLGKINDRIKFDEYCRYAHLQAEELINYFYYKFFDGDIDSIKKFIEEYISYYKGDLDKSSSLKQISYRYKLSAFVKAYKLDKGPFKSIIEFLSNLRNEMSHRSSMENLDEDKILIEVKKRKINITSSYFKFNEHSDEDKNFYKEGRYIYLKRKEDYDEIIENLNHLKEAILILLEDKL